VIKASDTRSAASWMTNRVDILTPIFTYYHFVFCHCAPTHTSTSFIFSKFHHFFAFHEHLPNLLVGCLLLIKIR
jgi:hypothetical protein